MNIGDVINYSSYVAVVMDVNPLTLALHTGETRIVDKSECVLLLSRSHVLEQFEEKIVKGRYIYV